MPEVTARTPVGAAIQAAKETVKQEQNRRTDPNEVTGQPQEVTKSPDDFAQRNAALARREKAIRTQQRELQQLKQQMEQMRQPQQPQVDPRMAREQMLNELRGRIEQDPMSVMSELGMEVNHLRDSLSSSQKLLEDRKAEAAEMAKKSLKSEVQMLMTVDPQAFEVIKAMNAVDAVTELVSMSVQEGDELSIHEAAQMVEDYLMEEAVKAAGIPKIKAKLTPAERAELQEAAEKHQPSVTLSRQESASRPLTAKDRRQRAMWAAQGLDPNTGKPR